MAKKVTLDSRVVRCCGSINFLDYDDLKLDLVLKDLVILLNKTTNLDSYYLIKHNETDTKHIHYAFIFKKQIRLQTILNLLADNLNVDTRAINIDKLFHVGAHLRYFLHQDSESKKLNKKIYDISDIVSNDNKEIIEGYINSNDDELSYDFLKSLVVAYSYEFQLMDRLGLKLYHKYRYEIRLLYENRAQLLAFDDLPF